MVGDLHRPWRYDLKPLTRRHVLRRHGTKTIQRFLVLLWILTVGSPDVGSRRLVAVQGAQAASSASENLSASCDGRQQPRPGAIYSAVAHLNYGVGLDLRADISIPGECEVNLPIDVSYDV